MKQNKILAMALAAIGASGVGVADAAKVGLTLTSVNSYSNNGSAAATLTGTVKNGWTYDSVAGTVTAPGTYHDTYWVGVLTIFQHDIQGLVFSSTGGATTGTAFVCYEGAFGPLNGHSSICGNYNFGPDGINQTTTSWGPGLAYTQVLGGDDIALGDPQNLVGFWSNFSTIGAVGAPGGTASFGNTNSNGDLSLATQGYVFNFAVTPPAANDGPIYVTPTVTKVIQVGKNDIGFTDPVTVVTTGPAPTKGVIGTISPSGPAGGMTIQYTPNVATSGSDTFQYQVTDALLNTGTATVTVDISPDTDGDGILDSADNCKTISNVVAGTVPGTPAPGVNKNQLDADGDGFGNRCDGDLNQTNPIGNVNTTDYTVFRSVINKAYTFSVNASKADLNGSGTVDTTDYTIFRTLINKLPGPSGLACAVIPFGTAQQPCLPAEQ